MMMVDNCLHLICGPASPLWDWIFSGSVRRWMINDTRSEFASDGLHTPLQLPGVSAHASPSSRHHHMGNYIPSGASTWSSVGNTMQYFKMLPAAVARNVHEQEVESCWPFQAYRSEPPFVSTVLPAGRLLQATSLPTPIIERRESSLQA